uniref:Amino acid transporter n=1 Tax=Cyclopterus lumpus TaxID=8103 RepID=A0A8C3AGJ1_CYCLU
MMPSLNDLSELDSVEVTEPQETQTYVKCNKPSGHVSPQNASNVVAFLMRNAFVVFTLAAVALGIGTGFALRHINMSAKDVKYLTFPGEILMRLLQMLVLPLIISITLKYQIHMYYISSVDMMAFGKIVLKAFSYYMVTTFIATFTGIALAVHIQPGKSSWTASVPSSGNAEAVQTVDSFLDIIRCVLKYSLETQLFQCKIYGTYNVTNENNDTVPGPGTLDGVNILGLLFFSVAFGLILGRMENEAKPLRDFFDSQEDKLDVLGLFFLLAGQIVKVTDSEEIGRRVFMYALTVTTGLLIHSLLTLPLIYFIVTRKNPFRFMLGLLQALTTAFGTSSSSAALPITLYCMEGIHNMNKQVTRFMLPIGATMNMDGAALYEAVAALFIAQINNMDFNLGQIIVLSLIVTVASTGAAGIPQAGMVSMILVLDSAGLPTEDISLLMIVDWILDRLRTTTNVLGDCVGVSVVQHLSTKELQHSNHINLLTMEKDSHIFRLPRTGIRHN